MVDVYLAEKPRSKEWFPESIPGLFRLGKGEIQDDIDYIHSNIGDRNSRRKRKNKEDKRGPAPATEEDRMSKRARLQAKTAQAKKLAAQLKSSHQSLRQDLQQTRLQITATRVELSRLGREVQVVTEEKNRLEEAVEEEKSKLESVKSGCKATQSGLALLQGQVKRESVVEADSAKQFRDLRLIDSLQEKPDTIQRLQRELSSSGKKNEDMLLFLNSLQVLDLTIDQLCDKVKVFLQQQQQHMHKLLEPQREETGAAWALATEANNQLEQQRTQNATFQTTIRQLEKKLKAKEEAISALEKRVEEQKVDKDRQRKKLETLKEKGRAYEEVLKLTTERASEAEDSLREIVDEVNVLRNGNQILQIGYNRLLLQFEEKLPGDGVNTPIEEDIKSSVERCSLPVEEIVAHYTHMQAQNARHRQSMHEQLTQSQEAEERTSAVCQEFKNRIVELEGALTEKDATLAEEKKASAAKLEKAKEKLEQARAAVAKAQAAVATAKKEEASLPIKPLEAASGENVNGQVEVKEGQPTVTEFAAETVAVGVAPVPLDVVVPADREAAVAEDKVSANIDVPNVASSADANGAGSAAVVNNVALDQPPEEPAPKRMKTA